MPWKRCGGCTRAIPETAVTCTYCGHVSDLSLSLTDLDRPAPVDPVEEFASVDDAMHKLALPLPVESVPTDAQAAKPAPPSATPLPPPAVAAMNQPISGLRPRHVATITTAVVAGVGLIFTLLTMRSSASPESAAPPANQTKATDKPNPATAAARAAASAAAARSAEPAPRWNRAPDGRWLPAGRRNLALEVPAANRVHVWTRDVRPVLVVRCLAGTMDVFVFTDSAARMEPQDQDHTVRLAFDDGGERTERWSDSETHDALFADDGATFAQELSAARSLRFGFTPHNAEPVVARFDVSGLSEHLAGAARQCTPRSQDKAQRPRAKRSETTEQP